MNKKSAIAQMYYGLRGGYDQIPKSEEYLQLLDVASKKEESMNGRLADDPELLALYEESNDSLHNMYSELCADHFAEGFRLGVLMGLDIASDEE